MEYVEEYQQLKEIFDLNQCTISIPNSPLIIKNIDFESHVDIPLSIKGQSTDSCISENVKFRYPVLINNNCNKSKEAIIMLHGLNERTWHKHLAGAKLLAEKTGKAVILFPMSFHINRGLPEWTDVRKMAGPLDARKKKYPQIREASLANLALSERLTECPQRFFTSGLQSTIDLALLMKLIREGQHPLFEKESKIDLFAYSIGCMLLQTFMISHPESLLNDTKIILFAGGSLFNSMQGISKYIMDSVAFETLKKYYLNITRKKKNFQGEIQDLIMGHSYGNAFRSFIAPEIMQNFRSKAISDFGNKLLIIALKDDKIMPVEGIRAATGDRFFKSKNFKMLHFPYPYSHENPFPVLYNKINKQVDMAFQSVFSPALKFLMQ